MRVGNTLSYSQNFLHSKSLVSRLISKTNISSHDIVVEIGTGLGIITILLQKKVFLLHTVEADKRYYEEARSKVCANNTIIYNTNFLDFTLPKTNYKVFSNIPFNYTSRIIKKLYFEYELPPSDTYITIQKEAYQKYSGVGRFSQVSLLLKPFYDFKILYRFTESDFTPAPNVKVYFIHIEKKKNTDIAFDEKSDYYDFVVYMTNIWAKDIKKALSKVYTYKQIKRISEDSNINLSAPLNGLTYSQFLYLFDIYKNYVDSDKKQVIKGSFSRQNSKNKKLKKIYRTRF